MLSTEPQHSEACFLVQSVNGGSSDKQAPLSESSGNNMILIAVFKQIQLLLSGCLAPLTFGDKVVAGQSPEAECSQLFCVLSARDSSTECKEGKY